MRNDLNVNFKLLDELLNNIHISVHRRRFSKIPRGLEIMNTLTDQGLL